MSVPELNIKMQPTSQKKYCFFLFIMTEYKLNATACSDWVMLTFFLSHYMLINHPLAKY